jgi:hypothetical protein
VGYQVLYIKFALSATIIASISFFKKSLASFLVLNARKDFVFPTSPTKNSPWQDKARISGYITDGRGDTQRCDDYPLFQDNAGIFAKEVQAKGRYALALKCQLL